MSNPPLVQILAAKHFIDKGLPENAAVALASVLYYESRLVPGSQGVQPTERGGEINPSGAYGVASWNGPRQRLLVRFAAAHHIPYDTLETQLDFVVNEIANGYPRSWAAIQSSARIDSIIDVLVREYEDPKNPEKEIAGAIEISGRLISVLGTYTKPVPPPAIPDPAPLPPTAPPTQLPPVVPAPAPPTGGWKDDAIAALTGISNDCNAEIKVISDVRDLCWVAITALGGTGASKMLPTTTPTQLPAQPAWMVNWRTTLTGALAGAAGIASMFPATAPYAPTIGLLATFLLGLVAKDSKVTGGTISNVTGNAGPPISLVDMNK